MRTQSSAGEDVAKGCAIITIICMITLLVGLLIIGRTTSEIVDIIATGVATPVR